MGEPSIHPRLPPPFSSFSNCLSEHKESEAILFGIGKELFACALLPRVSFSWSNAKKKKNPKMVSKNKTMDSTSSSLRLWVSEKADLPKLLPSSLELVEQRDAADVLIFVVNKKHMQVCSLVASDYEGGIVSEKELHSFQQLQKQGTGMSVNLAHST